MVEWFAYVIVSAMFLVMLGIFCVGGFLLVTANEADTWWGTLVRGTIGLVIASIAFGTIGWAVTG